MRYVHSEMHRIYANNNIECIIPLIDHTEKFCLNPQTEGTNRYTLLHLAVSANETEVVQRLCQTNKEHIDADKHVLHKAAEMGNLDIARCLLDRYFARDFAYTTESLSV